MYHDYSLLIMQVYEKSYGYAEFLSLYLNLHNFQPPPRTGEQMFFQEKQKYFSESVHVSPFIFGGTVLHM